LAICADASYAVVEALSTTTALAPKAASNPVATMLFVLILITMQKKGKEKKVG
jgi:hypothetical protein